MGNVDTRQLPGPECPAFDRCHMRRAGKLRLRDVLVVNHHLLMADLVLKEEGFGDLLPGADAIVIDEAHQLPEVASTFLGFAISGKQLPALARDLAVELVSSAVQTEVATSFAQTLDRRIVDLQDAFGAQERLEFGPGLR